MMLLVMMDDKFGHDHSSCDLLYNYHLLPCVHYELLLWPHSRVQIFLQMVIFGINKDTLHKVLFFVCYCPPLSLPHFL